MRSAILTLVSAILISIVAAYFSIVGLTALFPATALGVIVMGAVLETGKVVAAAWLHKNWKNTKVNWAHRIALCMMVVNLMAVTELGIYGYLYKGHMEQEGPKAGIGLQLDQYEQRINQLNADNARLTVRLNQLDKSVEVFFNNDKASQGLRARKAQTAERAEIAKNMDANNAAIADTQAKMLPLKHQTLDVDAKLGPVKNFAKFFGLKDDQAINIVILLIMSGFDPMAILLIISGQISLDEALARRRREKEEAETQTALPIEPPTPVDPEIPEPEVIEVEEPVADEVEESANEVVDEPLAPEVVEEPAEHERFAFLKELDEEREELRKEASLLQAERAAVAELEQTRAHLNTKSATLAQKQADLEKNELELAERVAELIELENKIDARQNALNAREAELLSWEPVIDEAVTDKDRVLALLEKNPAVIQDIIDIVEDAKSKPNGDTE